MASFEWMPNWKGNPYAGWVPNWPPSGGVAAPTVTSLSVSTGSAVGGTATTITGTGFLVGVTVTFGGVTAGSIVRVSSTSITCTAPAYTTTGPVNIVVTNTDAQSGTLTNGFTYTFAPADITDLQLWLNARSLSLNNGDNMPNPWVDLSGNGHDFPVRSNFPIYSSGASGINNIAAARMGDLGNQDNRGPRPDAFIGTTSFDMFFVIKPDSNPDITTLTASNGSFQIYSDSLNSAMSVNMFRNSGAGNATQVTCKMYDGVSDIFAPGVAYTNAAATLISFSWDGSTLSFSVNGGSASTIACSANTIGGATQSFVCGANGVWKGLIGEVLSYKTGMSSANRALVKNYLNGIYTLY